MKKLAIGTMAAFFLLGVLAYLTISVSDAIFQGTAQGRAIMAVMMEYSVANYPLLEAIGALLLLYAFYQVIPCAKHWNDTRRGYFSPISFSWKTESGVWALILAKAVFVWAVFGAMYAPK